MRESEVCDEDGKAYPDLATLSFDQFITSSKPIEVQLTYKDTQRFFDLIYSFYNSFDYYDDIILWLNDVTYISDSGENFQKKIKMYSKIDVDNFYIASVKGETVDIDNRIMV